MSNIQKELQQTQQKEIKSLQQNEVVNEVKLLMEQDGAEDLRIFRGLGDNHSIAVSENELGKKLELEKLNTAFEGAVYTTSQIKRLAIKYNLRFLLSQYYAGKIDIQVAAKLKEFSKTTNTEITESALKYNFYILAPEKSFKLQKERKIRFWEDKDPAIFYKIDEVHYRLIHKWGSDFSIQNRISGIKNQSWLSGFCSYALMCAIVMFPLVALAPLPSWKWYFMFFPILFGYFSQITKMNDIASSDEDCYSPKKWNKTKQIV